MDDRIKKLCDGVYLICGKVICFDAPDMFDMEDPGIQADFIKFAEDLYTEESEIRKRPYGDDTVCVFRYVEGGKRFTCGVYHMDDLKDGVKAVVREAVGRHV